MILITATVKGQPNDKFYSRLVLDNGQVRGSAVSMSICQRCNFKVLTDGQDFICTSRTPLVHHKSQFMPWENGGGWHKKFFVLNSILSLSDICQLMPILGLHLKIRIHATQPISDTRILPISLSQDWQSHHPLLHLQNYWESTVTQIQSDLSSKLLRIHRNANPKWFLNSKLMHELRLSRRVWKTQF